MTEKWRMFDDLSWTWPIINPPEKHVSDSEVLIEILRTQSSFPAKTLLNLGSGGGNDDYTLKNAFDVTGVDYSLRMLDLARKLNPQVEYVHGDMRNMLFDKLFDSAIITESINYMLTERDLKGVYETAYIHLNPGGMLLSCLSRIKESFKNNHSVSSCHSANDCQITWIENHYDPDTEDTVIETTHIYLIRRLSEQRIEIDRHVNGLFSLDTHKKILTQMGFTLSQIEQPDGRPLLLCRKPGL
jgi:SAM-dependent methyltransferase